MLHPCSSENRMAVDICVHHSGHSQCDFNDRTVDSLPLEIPSDEACQVAGICGK